MSVYETPILVVIFVALTEVVIYMRLLGQFIFFYDKISQAQISIKKNTRH